VTGRSCFREKGAVALPHVVTSGEGSVCVNRISDANFLIVLHSNYESILLSFRDDHGTDDG